MKWLQNGNLTKLVAFFVISVVITCTVSFAANGWESFVGDGTSKGDSVVENTPSEEKTEDSGDVETPSEDVSVVIPTPKYYHSITGLEIDRETSLKRPLCFVFSSTDPLYGISASYLTVEIPTEYGNTRLLCFTDDAKTLGKIGSLAPKRGYISNIASYFGGILFYYGKDDMIEYSYSEPEDELDFLETMGYCYTEYGSFVYTNADLVSAIITNSKVNQALTDTVSIPYTFVADTERVSLSGKSANNVSISYSDGNSTQLTYSVSEGRYLLSKNTTSKTDLLNDKALKYDNAFILYANSTTYESEETTQLILNTTESGSGIYMTDGEYVEITWKTDASGALVFYDTNGNQLAINRGTTYIAYVKSSLKNTVKIS